MAAVQQANLCLNLFSAAACCALCTACLAADTTGRARQPTTVTKYVIVEGTSEAVAALASNGAHLPLLSVPPKNAEIDGR